jgi:hypothetical protein
LFHRHAGAEFHRLAGAKCYFHLQMSVDAGIIVIEQLQDASASQGCKLLTFQVAGSNLSLKPSSPSWHGAAASLCH